MDVTVTEATLSITGAVLDLVVGLQFEAFIAECWVADRGLFVWVMEGDIVLVGRALYSSDSGQAATMNRWAGRRLRIDVVKYASGEPCVYESTTGLK